MNRTVLDCKLNSFALQFIAVTIVKIQDLGYSSLQVTVRDHTFTEMLAILF